MFKNKKMGFYCFSPPVMIATFLIEIILLIATLIKRTMNKTVALICITLFSLAMFQLCEFFVCGGFGASPIFWSRLGFIFITTLPPLGLHLVSKLAGKKTGWIVWFGYGLMLTWILFFGFSENAFTNHQCVSNYVIFSLHHIIGYLYSAYYYILLLIGILTAFSYGEKTKIKHKKESLFAMIVGYLVFLVPTATANTMNPATLAGIPSIMCGFAILFALILFFYIIPRNSKPRT